MSTHEYEAASPRPVTPARRPVEEKPEAAFPIDARRQRLDATAVLRLQRATGNASVAALLGEDREEVPSPVKDVLGSGRGSPLDPATRQKMESAFDQDFGDVRVHTDPMAAASARSVNAHAYTSGTDVVFQPDKYSPGTEGGQRMLAHELTHVVQQKAGPVAGSPAPGGISVSDPGDSFEREADKVADLVVSGERAAVGGQKALSSAPQLQRQEGEEEEVQGSFVQRQEGEEEEVQGSFVQRQEGEEEESEAG